MIPINFAKQSYQSRSLPLNSQRCINCYLEPAPKDSKSQDMLIGTPGLEVFANLGSGAIRGMEVMNNELYVVSGDNTYKVSTGGSGTLLGSLGTVSGAVVMANNATDVVIVKDSGDAWLADTSSLTQVSDGDYVSSDSVTVLDGYGIFGRADSNRYHISGLLDLSAYDALDFASAEESPDLIVRVFAHKGNLWIFGEKSIEVHYNAGAGDFPFRPLQQAAQTRGCAAKLSVVAEDNTLFWLGDDRVVYRADGYTPKRVSTFAIERAIQDYSTVSDCEAFSYTQDGHKFIVLTFPTQKVTWVYDIATGLWHERQSFEKERWRAAHHAFFDGKHLVGDFETGKIYEIDITKYTEDGNTIQRKVVSSPVFDAKHKLFHDRLILDFDTGLGLENGQGSDPQVMLRFSDDAYNWSNELWRDLGKIGKYQTQVEWLNMGMAKERLYEITMTDPIPFRLTGAYAEVGKGDA